MFSDQVNVVGVTILELIVEAEVKLEAEEDEREKPPKDRGEFCERPAVKRPPARPGIGLVFPNLSAQSQEVKGRECSGDVLGQRGGET